MTEQLKTMLDDAADGHPDFVLRGDPWRRGRRMRLGRRLAGVAGAAVTVAAAVVGTVVLTTPDLISAPEPAQEEPAEPALPDTLHEVPLNIPDISDDPLGEPAAVVYFAEVRTGLFSETSRPVVVGAESGKARAVREADVGVNVALSPDGTMLAVGTGRSADETDDPPTVLVVDLLTGESEVYTLPDNGLGGAVAEYLVWHPDSSRIAVTANVITSRSEDGHTSRWVPGWLDLTNGEWDEHGLGEILAISSDGERIVVDGSFKPRPDNRTVVSGIDGIEVAELLPYPVEAVFSPDGRHIATVGYESSAAIPSDPPQLSIFNADSGDLVTAVYHAEPEAINTRLLGWGEHGVVVGTFRETRAGTLDTVVERIEPSDVANPARETVLVAQSNSGNIGIAANILDAAVREATPPEAPFDWLGLVPDPFLLVLVAAIGIVAVMAYLGGRVSSGRGSATGRGSTDH